MQEVPIAEAAKRLGKSIDSIRRRIGKGELKARKVPSPHGEIYLVELPNETPGEVSDSRDKDGNSNSEVESLRKTISILETELEARRREVQELHVLLLQQSQKQIGPGQKNEEREGARANISWWHRIIFWAN
jgi:hypothetical protein